MSLGSKAPGAELMAERMRKMLGMMVIMLVFSVVPFFFLARFTKAIMQQKTSESISHLREAARIWEHPSHPIDVTQLVEEVHRLYPSEIIKNGEVLDGWNHPVAMTIEVQPTLTRLKLRRAGPDGIWGNEDDFETEVIIPRKSQ